MGRGQVCVAVDAQIAPSLIVGEDDDDIGSFGLNHKGTEDTEGD